MVNRPSVAKDLRFRHATTVFASNHFNVEYTTRQPPSIADRWTRVSLLAKIWRIFAPFFNNPFQNGAYIYWRWSDNFSRRYMLFIYVLEGYFKVNFYKEGHFWAQCLLPFVDSQSTRRSKRSVKRNAGATSALDKIRFEVNFFKICKFIIFNFLPIAYESNDQFIHVLGNFVRQASEQSLR